MALAASTTLFLGNDLLAYLMLALGGALFAGNALALVRPPSEVHRDDLPRAPLARSLVMMVAGGVVALWALASLLSR